MMKKRDRITEGFFERDALEIAPELIGCKLVRKISEDIIHSSVITEIEVYRGDNDLACHARKGKTNRNQVMFERGGKVYVYLIYGMYWMLNFVTGEKDSPQAILIRGIEGFDGPGKLTKFLAIDKSLYGADLYTSSEIWVEYKDFETSYITAPRIGISYAGEYWENIEWRYILKDGF